MKKAGILSSLLMLLTFLTNDCFSQVKFDLPDNITLKAKEDYARYEGDIIKAATWLQETDMDKQTEKRKQVGKFVMEWMLGSPNVSVELNQPLMDLFEGNAGFMAIYFANAAKYVLENKNAPGKFNPVKAGLLSLVKVYKKGIAINENKAFGKLVAANDKNNLDDFIVDKMKVVKD